MLVAPSLPSVFKPPFNPPGRQPVAVPTLNLAPPFAPQRPDQAQFSIQSIQPPQNPLPQTTVPSQAIPIQALTPKPLDPAYRFAVMGDAGTGDEGQAAVARQMNFWQQLMPFKSVMVLGDNVYQDGEPALFQDRIAKPYGDLFQRGVKFFPVMGNHDVKKGYGNWQLTYWGVPPFYSFKLGPKGSEVEFFAIDTNLFTPGLTEKAETEKAEEAQKGKPAAKTLDNPAQTRQKAESQYQWLAQSLANSTAPMKVIYGHHPMYSKGAATKPIRDWQQKALAQTLEPLLQRYQVDLYMSGHEHHYEKPTQVNGIYHLVSGSAGKLDTPKRGGPEGNGLIKQLHFMLFDITPQGLTYRTISGNGAILDSGTIPRKNANPATASNPNTPVPQLNLTA